MKFVSHCMYILYNLNFLLVWLDTAVDYNWREENVAFLAGYSSFGKSAVFDSLSEAQQKCLEVSKTSCGGVTYTSGNKWQLRGANEVSDSPTCEISFVRP